MPVSLIRESFVLRNKAFFLLKYNISLTKNMVPSSLQNKGLEPVTHASLIKSTVYRSTNRAIGGINFSRKKKATDCSVAFNVAPQTGLEPVTHGLTVHRSTN